MRLNTSNDNDTFTSGSLAKTTYKSSSNAKAWAVMTNGLYQNKIGSIVREYCFNGVDSHTLNKTPELPFEVHLPNSIEPWFSVRDFGVGLSRDGVMNTFTTLFESTKDDSNEEVGAYGLGAKSAFSLVDSFTVNSIHDGVLSSYSAEKVGYGFPEMHLLSETPTDEHNGVEIIIPVQSDKFAQFASELASQLAFLKVKPNVVNSANFRFADVNSKVVITLPCGMEINSVNNDYHSKQISIVQGGVGYPLLPAQLSHYYKSQDQQTFLRSIGNRGANVYFDIGQIEVTPSREGISYTDSTIKNIADKIEQARLEMSAYVSEHLDTLPNNWERIIWLNKAGALASNTLSESNKWGITTSSSIITISSAAAAVRQKTITVENPLTKIITTDNINYSAYDCHTYFNKPTRSRSMISVNIANTWFAPSDDIKIFVLDDCVSAVKRIRHLVSQTASVRTLVYKPIDDIEITDAEIALISERLGGATVQRVSSLALPPAAARIANARKGYTIPKLWVHDSECITNNVKDWTPLFDSVKDISEGGYYVIKPSGNHVVLSSNVRELNILRNYDLIETTVYAIREKDLKHIENDPKWTLLETAVKEIVDDIISTNQSKVVKLAIKNARGDFNTNLFYNKSVSKSLHDNLDKIVDSQLVRLVKLHTAKPDNRSSYIFDLLREHCADRMSEITKRCIGKYVELADKMQKRYVLLDMIDSYSKSTNMASHFVKYVNAVAA